MKKQTFKTQLHDNAIALISLVVAILAMALNTWRLEQTEKNRNVRQAGFEILKNLGELQSVINLTAYNTNATKSTDPIQGWGYIAMMGDIAVLMPNSVTDNLNQLTQLWSENWKDINSDPKSVDKISHQIDLTREAVMTELHYLH
jgi:hypothetical protein